SAAGSGPPSQELGGLDRATGAATRAADIHPTSSSGPAFLTVVGSRLVFSADDGTTGFELWSHSLGEIPKPAVSFTVDTVVMAETGASKVIEVRLSEPAPIDLSIPIIVNHATASGADYVLAQASVRVLAGPTPATSDL